MTSKEEREERDAAFERYWQSYQAKMEFDLRLESGEFDKREEDDE
jgi:hypothetical protein